jgi:hypothetical protein
VYAYFFDNANNNIGNSYVGGNLLSTQDQAVTYGSGAQLSYYQRLFNIATVPANCAYVTLRLRKFDTASGQTTSFMFVARAQVEQVAPTATAPGPWAPSGYTDTTAVRALNPITGSNVSTYIASAAIQDAQIGNLSATKLVAGSIATASLNVVNDGGTGWGYARSNGKWWYDGNPGWVLARANDGSSFLEFIGSGMTLRMGSGPSIGSNFSITSPNFSIDQSGTMIVDNASIRRRLVAASGQLNSGAVMSYYIDPNAPTTPVVNDYVFMGTVATGIYDPNQISDTSNQPYYAVAYVPDNTSVRNVAGTTGSPIYVGCDCRIRTSRTMSGGGSTTAGDWQILIDVWMRVTGYLTNNNWSFQVPITNWIVYKL